MWRFFLFLIVVFISRTGLSQSELVASAYSDYVAGRMDDALIKYTKLVQEGFHSADLYYNLGCIYLKQQNISQARLYFEKALRLNPSSSPIQQGIRQSKAGIEPDIEALPPFIMYKWFLKIRNLFSASGWGWLLLFTITLLSVIGILNLTGKLSTFFRNRYIILLFPVLIGIFYLSRSFYENKKESILILNQNMHVAPDPNSQVALPLGAGTKVQILDSLSAWYKVNLENNDEGWLPKVALAGI